MTPENPGTSQCVGSRCITLLAVPWRHFQGVRRRLSCCHTGHMKRKASLFASHKHCVLTDGCESATEFRADHKLMTHRFFFRKKNAHHEILMDSCVRPKAATRLQRCLRLEVGSPSSSEVHSWICKGSEHRAFLTETLLDVGCDQCDHHLSDVCSCRRAFNRSPRPLTNKHRDPVCHCEEAVLVLESHLTHTHIECGSF